MPGPVAELKKIYNELVNGTTVTDAAAALGSIAAMARYIAAGSVTAYQGATPIVPTMISTLSDQSVGPRMRQASSALSYLSQAWPAANRGLLIPFILEGPATVVKLWCHNGTTAAGNTDMAIYNDSYVRQVSIGPTAQAGTDVIQEFNIADTPLAAGRYYLGISNSLGTSTFFASINPPIEFLKGMGLAQQASVATLPNPFVPVVVTDSYVPVCGLSLRTLVA